MPVGESTVSGGRGAQDRSEESAAAFVEAIRSWFGDDFFHRPTEALQERGIHGDLREVLVELHRQLAYVLSLMPPRGRADAAGRELTEEEARVLKEGGADLSPWGAQEKDPRVATTAKHAVLLATGLSTEEAARALGVTEARVRQRLGSERTLLGVKTPTGWRLPTFQFEGASEVPGVGRVLREMDPGLHVLSVANWFSLPKPELRAEYLDGGGAGEPREDALLSPREWLLRGGETEALLGLAREL